jgi:hypothetical protein
VAALVAIAVLMAARPASAAPPPEAAAEGSSAPTRREPTAGDFATARTALTQGMALREKGDLQEALARLVTAYELVPTPVTGFELGKTHMMLGHVLQAHELFKKVERMPPSMEESTRSQTARSESARLSAELEPRIPSVHLTLTLPKGASAVVHLDDEEIPMPTGEATRAVDPGPHDITTKAGDGPEEKIHVDVAESETKNVALAPKWIVPKAPPKEERVIYVPRTNPLAFIGFATAAVAVVVTLVSGYIYLDARDDAKNKCGNNFCPPVTRSNFLPENTVIDTSYNSDKTRYQVSGALMIVGGITTAVFLGVGIVGAARPLKERVVAKPKVTPTIGLGSLGLSGTF